MVPLCCLVPLCCCVLLLIAHAVLLGAQGLIRHFRPVMEERIKAANAQAQIAAR